MTVERFAKLLGVSDVGECLKMRKPQRDQLNERHGKIPHGLNEEIYTSGQIIVTSHDLTPNGGLVRELPLFQGNLWKSRLVKYYNLARYIDS